MKKRLRKKLRLAEFKEFGFGGELSMTPISDDKEVEFFDAFFEFLESMGLQWAAGEHRAALDSTSLR